MAFQKVRMKISHSVVESEWARAKKTAAPLEEAAKLLMLTQIAETRSFHLRLDLVKIGKLSDDLEHHMYWNYKIRPGAL